MAASAARYSFKNVCTLSRTSRYSYKDVSNASGVAAGSVSPQKQGEVAGRLARLSGGRRCVGRSNMPWPCACNRRCRGSITLSLAKNEMTHLLRRLKQASRGKAAQEPIGRVAAFRIVQNVTWLTSPTGAKLCTITSSPPGLAFTRFHTILPCRQLTLFTQLRTGACNLTGHKAHFEPRELLCACGSEPETCAQFFLHCPLYAFQCAILLRLWRTGGGGRSRRSAAITL